MTVTLKFLLLLSLILWLGGILFFSAAVAPSVFAVLTPIAGGNALAGNIVARALGILHWMGLSCGAAFVICSSLLARKFRMPENFLVLAMLLLTALSQFGVTTRMAILRADAIHLELLPASDPRRVEFNRLHFLSVSLEASVLVLGLGVAALVSRKFTD